MPNENLHNAKNAKMDEFYTQYADIQREVNAYLEYDPDVFKDKTILLPCDDPEWSNFTKFFAQNFESFGLRKLISTSYAANSKPKELDYQPTLFETIDPRFDVNKTRSHGKIFTLTKDQNKDGKININDLKWEYLEGDGDFRSEEVRKLRDESDIIITNPPFSLFIEFFAWIIESKKQFLIIGNKNAVGCKEIFPLFKENQVWIGKQSMSFDMVFDVPDAFAEELKKKKAGSKYKIIDNKIMARSPGCWFTNMEHGRRHMPLRLNTEVENIKHSKRKEIREKGYLKYDNYDVIEVPYYDVIPSDYKGIMGVPVSFLDKFCPDQFVILGSTQRGCHDLIPDTKKYNDYWEYDKKTNKKTRSSGGKTNENANLAVSMETKDPKKNYFMNAEGKIIQSLYTRIFIRRKDNGSDS